MKSLLLILLFTSCSSDTPPNYSKVDMFEMASKGDPNVKIEVPGGIDKALIHCTDYKPACRYGYVVTVLNLKMKVLFYENQNDAIRAARRVRGYVARNWVLDEVTGEPVLEKFSKKYLNAVLASSAKIIE